jgi:hypothetical protein
MTPKERKAEILEKAYRHIERMFLLTSKGEIRKSAAILERENKKRNE